MIAYIIREDLSFKINVGYHSKIVALMTNIQIIEQITKSIRRYPIDKLDYVIEGLLNLGVNVKQVSMFEKGSEIEILTCLFSSIEYEGDEEPGRFEVHIDYRPNIITRFKAIHGRKFDFNRMHWTFLSDTFSEFENLITEMGHKLVLVDANHKFPPIKPRVFKAIIKRNNYLGFIEAQVDYSKESSTFLKSIEAKFDMLTKRWNVPFISSTTLIDTLTNDLGYSVTTLGASGKFKVHTATFENMELSK